MLKEIIKIFTEKTTLVDQMGVEFIKMLEMGKNMFISVTDFLYLGGDKKQVYEKIYPPDKELNKLECRIRSEIVTHISVAGSTNLSAVLIFMSVVKDAERIGDYIKNTYEVAVRTANFKRGKYGQEIADIKNKIVSAFDSVMKVFKASDRQGAINSIREIGKLEKQCDGMVNDLVVNNTIENSVAHAMVVRYFKRILAHLANIATAVIMPVNKLDYFDEESLPRPQD
jgi:phosphate transport system protein